MTEGFQPLMSGTRGNALWGPGTYFARDAKPLGCYLFFMAGLNEGDSHDNNKTHNNNNDNNN